jgi:hypothetical protein
VADHDAKRAREPYFPIQRWLSVTQSTAAAHIMLCFAFSTGFSTTIERDGKVLIFFVARLFIDRIL